MSNAIAWVVATLVTLPIVCFYLVYLISVKTTKNKKKSMKLAVDVSTTFFIIAVYYIAYEIWGLSLFWALLSFIIIVAMIFTVIHWKVSEDIKLGKLLKGIWRFNFILFFLAYIVLSIYGLVVSIYSIT